MIWMMRILLNTLKNVLNLQKRLIHTLYVDSKQEPYYCYSLFNVETHCSYYDSYFFVKSRRSFINPNDGFVKQLKMFEDLLQKNDYDLNKINFKSISMK